MKFLDLNGLKHLLKRLVKYDKGSTTNVTVSKLSVGMIMPDTSGSDIPEVYVPYIEYPDLNIMIIGTPDSNFSISSSGLKSERNPTLEKKFPEEFSKLRSQDLFLTVASILHTLKEKGIMQ